MKPEAQFEVDLRNIAPHFGCEYIKIPDVIPLRRYGKIIAHQRPFDAVLVTPKITYVIECKVNYNNLAPHQTRYRERVDEINGSFVVLRKIFLKKKIKYRIELLDGKYETDDIRDIFIKLIKGD
jgi:hypothetical protein